MEPNETHHSGSGVRPPHLQSVSYDTALRSGPLWTYSHERLAKTSPITQKLFSYFVALTKFATQKSLCSSSKFLSPSGLPFLLVVHSGPLTTIVSRRKTLVDLAPSANGSLSGLPPQLTPPPPPPCVFVTSQALSLSRVSKNISTASP